MQATLRISELIAKLEAMQARHGNVWVFLDDPDTSWLLGIDVEYSVAEPPSAFRDWRPACVTIVAAYSGIAQKTQAEEP
jgi:hypothetical protein